MLRSEGFASFTTTGQLLRHRAESTSCFSLTERGVFSFLRYFFRSFLFLSLFLIRGLSMDCQFFSTLPDPTVEFLQANRISSKLKKLWQNSATSLQGTSSSSITNTTTMLDNTLQVSLTTTFTCAASLFSFLAASASYLSTVQLQGAKTAGLFLFLFLSLFSRREQSATHEDSSQQSDSRRERESAS